ncbi:AGE family epimerase/isomerase [Candidatus Puniceispirillum sp.]|uniref:AGE family epimerase/isomerase n=1 Tax=Candidatus Puniceispirillum sp. TaxID=2026719 RepID=UPI003F6A27D7
MQSVEIPPKPDFESAAFLRQHVSDIISFYEPVAFDPTGGFFHHFRDDGSIYDADTRHLVSSARFVFNYANAFIQTNKPHYAERAAHGLRYLKTHHLSPHGHYLWQRSGAQIEDGRAMAYGHAFVMLAAASASHLKIAGAAEMISDVWDFLEENFFEPAHNAYADEYDDTLTTLSSYRGQNANMHMVEALIAAYEATGDQRYLDRADNVAHKFTIDLAALGDGQIWEHYNTNWAPDWDYNIDKPDDLFKPWGFQPGHQVEWAKLLLQIDAHNPADWHLETATSLYHKAFDNGWDTEYGGLVYGYAPDGSFADAHKYFWVQAEAIATAWRLYDRTGDNRYRDDYNRLWAWSWDHLIDHKYGAWFRITSREGKWIEPYKSPAGKVDYHTMGACWDVLGVMTTDPE